MSKMRWASSVENRSSQSSTGTCAASSSFQQRPQSPRPSSYRPIEVLGRPHDNRYFVLFHEFFTSSMSLFRRSCVDFEGCAILCQESEIARPILFHRCRGRAHARLNISQRLPAIQEQNVKACERVLFDSAGRLARSRPD
jgi:hypothetical protein